MREEICRGGFFRGHREEKGGKKQRERGKRSRGRIVQLSPHRLSWQQTHPKTASGFFLDTSMVRLDPLRPGGRLCRSSLTVAASSGCCRVAVAAPLSMAPLLGSPLLKTMPRWSIQS
eukprot:XP_019072645.1 PREDICTED: uncharacterized protein LOC109121809 [Vitis vinifera]